MATRFYLPSSGAAGATPSVSGWDATTGYDRIKCVTSKSNSSHANKATAANTGQNLNFLARQYVSDPIGAQTITGTVKGIVLAFQSASTAGHANQLRIRVCSNDGSSFTGTLIDFNNGAQSATHQTTTGANRKLPRDWSGAGQSVTQVVANANDRIVIEIGARGFVNGESGETSTFDFGDLTSDTDCAENETDTAANAPWIEFSQNLFGPPPEQLDQIVREILLRGA